MCYVYNIIFIPRAAMLYLLSITASGAIVKVEQNIIFMNNV